MPIYKSLSVAYNRGAKGKRFHIQYEIAKRI